MMAIDDDFLDGCELDFTEASDDEMTSALRPLFPDGTATPRQVREWQTLFRPRERPRRRQSGGSRSFRYETFHSLATAVGPGYDLGIVARLRAKGLIVVEVAGWQSRGSSYFNPHGSVDHHTAGSRNGDAPSLGICINGRPDLSGPLCNVFIARNNVCFVVAAGRANHAGAGGYAGLSGNSSVYGVERENVGTSAEPWRPDQTDTAARVHAALIEGRAPASHVCEHKDWTRRKIDAHTITGADLRNRVASYLGYSIPLDPKDGSIVARPIVKASNPNQKYVVVGDNLMPIGSDDELSYYVRSGLVAAGPPEVWTDNYFNALEIRLNLQDK